MLKLRTWIECGFQHAKDDFGWADYRVTDFASIERWWERVMSAYTLIILRRLVYAAYGQLAIALPAAPETSAPPASYRPARPGIP